MSKRWAFKRNNEAVTVFVGADNKDVAYPDIANFLEEVASNVITGWRKVGDVWGPPSALPRMVDTEDFLTRFTNAELNSILGNNTARNFVIQRVLSCPQINLDASQTDTYMSSLVTAGFITSQRKIEILS